MAGSIPTELGVKPVNQLIRQYAVPGIIAMTASSLYNMVDSIYIGHIVEVGSLAISGLAVTFPLMNISTAFGTLVGVGAATMISVLLGQKNYAVANKVLSNEVTLNIITGLVFTFVTLMWMDPILRFFGATEATLPFARQYMTVIAIGNAVTHLYFGLNSVIRSSGNPKTAMGLTLFTVTSNAILDPVFIFVFKLGIQGAAIATVLCINQQLVKWGGDLALGAYGIVNRISFLFVMIIMGFNQGMQPIAGYNYGARQYARVREVYVKTAGWATLVCLFGFIISEVLPGPTVSIFTPDPVLHDMAARGLRMMNLAFPIIGFQMVTTNLFQCLGMVNKSIFLSLSRQLLFLLPCIYILPPLLESETGVWYSFPISDTIAAIVTAFFAVGLLRNLGRLKDGDDPAILGSKI